VGETSPSGTGGCAGEGDGGDVAASQIVLELADLRGELALTGLEPFLELGDEPLGLLQLAEPKLGLGFELGLAHIERSFTFVLHAASLDGLHVRGLEPLLEPVDAPPLGFEQLFELLDAGLAIRKLGGTVLDRVNEALDPTLQLVVLRLVDF
jgi:hypothetical protein